NGMEFDDFIARCAVLDLETSGDKILKIGAILNDAIFERKGKFGVQLAFAELDQFAERAEFLLGHNILEHDLPILRRASPALDIYKKPVIDTLFLSPLAFPENPYHRLIKDYKLVKDAVSDPVADSRLAISVFQDQWKKFPKMMAEGHSDILSFYRHCFVSSVKAGRTGFRGIAHLLQILGAEDLSIDEARAV